MKQGLIKPAKNLPYPDWCSLYPGLSTVHWSLFVAPEISASSIGKKLGAAVD